jgi:hypothetical protein
VARLELLPPSLLLMTQKKLYHMCEKALWEKAISDGEAYYPSDV